MAAGSKRSIPDDSYLPDVSLLRKIEKGSLFVRIYDRGTAAGRYKAHTFNPQRISQKEDVPTRRGRYTPVDRPPLFDSLYLAQYEGSEAVAVREYIDYEKLELSIGARIIRRDQVIGYSAAYLELSRDIFVVDFTSKGTCVDYYGADQGVLEGNDSSLTRLWARWVVANVPDADGILYRSHQFGSDVAGFPLVLFGEPGAGDCSYLEPYQSEVALDEIEGFALLSSVAHQTNYYPESPWL